MATFVFVKLRDARPAVDMPDMEIAHLDDAGAATKHAQGLLDVEGLACVDVWDGRDAFRVSADGVQPREAPDTGRMWG